MGLFKAKTNIFSNFLLEQGYLSLVNEEKFRNKLTVKIPNKEIEMEFMEKFRLNYSENTSFWRRKKIPSE